MHFSRRLLILGLWAGGGALACGKLPLKGTDLVSGKGVEIALGGKDRGAVVVFLSAKCPCSKSHEPVLAKLSQEFADFRFVGVHANQDEEESLAGFYFRQAALPFPVLRDKGAVLADAFGAFKTPHAYVVDSTGRCVYAGGVDDSKDADRAREHYLRGALEAVRAGKEPPVREARAMGCIISRG